MENVLDGVLTGYLTKQGGSEGGRKSWKKRWFVLTPDRLAYFASESDMKAKGIISLEEFLSIRAEPFDIKKNVYPLVLEVKGRKLNLRIDGKEQFTEWFEALESFGTLHRNARETKTVTSTSKFEDQVLVNTIHLARNVAHLHRICDRAISISTNVPFKQMFRRLSSAILPRLIMMINSALKASKSPYNEAFVSAMAMAVDNLKELIREIASASQELKDSPNMQQEMRDSMKQIKAALEQIEGLTLPDTLEEAKQAVETLQRSLKSLVDAASAFQKVRVTESTKSVKNDLRQLFGVINVGKPLAINLDNYSVMQNKALNLNYLVKDLILAASANILQTESASNELTQIYNSCSGILDEIVALSKETFSVRPRRTATLIVEPVDNEKMQMMLKAQQSSQQGSPQASRQLSMPTLQSNQQTPNQPVRQFSQTVFQTPQQSSAQSTPQTTNQPTRQLSQQTIQPVQKTPQQPPQQIDQPSQQTSNQPPRQLSQQRIQPVQPTVQPIQQSSAQSIPQTTNQPTRQLSQQRIQPVQQTTSQPTSNQQPPQQKTQKTNRQTFSQAYVTDEKQIFIEAEMQSIENELQKESKAQEESNEGISIPPSPFVKEIESCEKEIQQLQNLKKKAIEIEDLYAAKEYHLKLKAMQDRLAELRQKDDKFKLEYVLNLKKQPKELFKFWKEFFTKCGFDEKMIESLTNLFVENELQEQDLPDIDLDLLQSMDISVAKTRLTIMKTISDYLEKRKSSSTQNNQNRQRGNSSIQGSQIEQNKQQTQQALQQSSQQTTQQTLQQSSQQTSQQQTQQSSQQTAQQTLQQSSQQTAQQTLQQSSQQTTLQTLQQSSQQQPNAPISSKSFVDLFQEFMNTYN